MVFDFNVAIAIVFVAVGGGWSATLAAKVDSPHSSLLVFLAIAVWTMIGGLIGWHFRNWSRRRTEHRQRLLTRGRYTKQ
jgi:hypothetical protein